MSYQMIAAHQSESGIERMCQMLGVSVSGYYAWRQRQPSRHAQTDKKLLEAIHRMYEDGRGLYGSPRIHAMLKQQGTRCSRKRVARLMRQAGLHSRRRPKRRVCTTDSRHHRPVAANLLKRDFSATAPNQKWVGDIVAVWTDGCIWLPCWIPILAC